MTAPNHDHDSDGFRIIENEDAGLRYSEGWNVIILDPREKRVGVTWTDRENASVEVQFYGTSISIHGRIFNTTSYDAAFVVSLDGLILGESVISSGAVSQQVFSTPSGALSNHTLTLTMHAGGVPLYLDYFNVTLANGSGSTDGPTLTSNSNTTCELNRSLRDALSPLN
ncbi:hypothetical protein BJ165DRAFT_633146 [Panaeolus papilionaceus]|nr:hypothetical protein BJ165DRAFT_633146 [Panaeolus papilionaceus]